MTPPKASESGNLAPSDAASAVLFCASLPACVETIKRRADFLRAAAAQRVGTGSFMLQARPREDGHAAMRIGFTASKKIGNAVARNRAKRRMRALAHGLLPQHGRAGWDYVLVAKPGATITRDFAAMQGDFARALAQIHKPKAKE